MVERRLGRGLDFFLSGSREAPSNGAGDEVMQLEVSRLAPGVGQPRREFSAPELEELAQSIRSTGVLQPILVRKVENRFEIIAGERRWRAAKIAGLERVPALVRDVTKEMAAIYGLVENLQRADLNAIEKAKAFQRIQAMTKSNHEEIARQVGLDRSTVTNFLRLLELPDMVQDQVSRGTLTMGHARALLGLKSAKEQIALADEVVRNRLSVRQVEALVQELAAATERPAEPADSESPAPEPAKEKSRPLWLKEIEENLAEAVGASVAVKYGRKRSKITIECIGREDFERVYEMLKSLGAG